jgi:hypothetical protein
MAGLHRAVLWCCLMIGLLSPTASSAGDPVPTSRAKQRAGVEEILAKPLEWNPKEGEPVTIDHFIAHVRERFGLAIRWDAASVQMLSADGESLFGSVHGSPSRPVLTYNTAATSPNIQAYDPAAAPAYSQTYTPIVPERLRTHVTDFAPPATADPGTGKLTEVLPPSVPVAGPDTAPKPEELQSLQPAPINSADESAVKKKPAATSNERCEGYEDEPLPHQVLSSRPLPPSTVALQGATVGEALEQLLAAAAPPMSGMSEDIGFPVSIRAFTLDYLIDGRSIVITTRLRANAIKETRVYRIANLKGMPPEQLAKTICHSIRPWSWRSQATEIADRLAARFPKGALKLPNVSVASAYLPEGIVPASAEVPPRAPGAVSQESATITPEQLAGLGQLLTGGAIAAVEALVNTAEIVHYGDPPTGVMEVLPGVLVITQSQAAHREIAALLEELGSVAQ